MEMSREDDALSRELDIYIRKHLHSEGITLKDFLNLGGQYATGSNSSGAKWALEFLLKNLELTFSEKLVELIEEKGRKPSEIYTKAGITKTHFSKIRSDKDYHPTKETALAFAIALHLDLRETNDLLRRAGYSISHSHESDLIVEFYIKKGIYNIDRINNQLDLRGHKTLTNWRRNRD
jgi:hypothetical protein